MSIDSAAGGATRFRTTVEGGGGAISPNFFADTSLGISFLASTVPLSDLVFPPRFKLSTAVKKMFKFESLLFNSIKYYIYNAEAYYIFKSKCLPLDATYVDCPPDAAATQIPFFNTSGAM